MKNFNKNILALLCSLLGLNAFDLQAMAPHSQKPKSAIYANIKTADHKKATECVGGLPLPTSKIYGTNLTVSSAKQHKIFIQRRQRNLKRDKMSEAQLLDLDCALKNLCETYVLGQDRSLLSTIATWTIDPDDNILFRKIKQKLHEGANPDILTETGAHEDFLDYISYENRYQKLLKVLIPAGLNVNGRYKGITLLARPTYSNFNIAKLLIQGKADVNQPTGYHDSVIELAENHMDNLNLDHIKLLLEAKANPDFNATFPPQNRDYREFKSDDIDDALIDLHVQFGGYPQHKKSNTYQSSSWAREAAPYRFMRAWQQVTTSAKPVLAQHFIAPITSLILDYYAPTFKNAYDQTPRPTVDELIQKTLKELALIDNHNFAGPTDAADAAVANPAITPSTPATPAAQIPGLDEDDNTGIAIAQNNQPARDLPPTENPSSLQYRAPSSTSTYSGSSTSLTREQGTPPRPEFNEHKTTKKNER